MRRLALAAVLVLAALPARAQEGGPPPPPPDAAALRAVAARAVDGYILPGYAALDAAAKEAARTIGAECTAPSADQPAVFAATFRDLLAAWAAVDFLRFGPMAENGRLERFAFWPDPHGTGTRQLRRMLADPDPALLAPGALARQSAAVQGLPALEGLLFAGDGPIGGTEPKARFRCDLAVAVAGNLETIAAEAVAGWQGPDGFAAVMTAPGPDNRVYRDPLEPVTEILKAVLLGLEQVRDQRLTPALGADAASAKPSRAPYGRSGATLAYLAASTAAIDRLAQQSGLLGLAPPAWKTLPNAAHFETGNVVEVFETAPALDTALTEPKARGKLEYARVVLKGLEELYQVQFAGAAGLSPGFNALDGD
ncbi:imelysin family protein [Prosthecomicrobium pneumaticum]|uniref:Imelysin-like domain-containing protein n=1 Tax=Prosthecomicrobium pneumaticum TaxID=81895 RepID=A0A7W9FLC8_9HYPH|nr:imelysin family protein [Prosthecomicrobium pneumaticum]MBB5752794.1 hypothetical protein [Prosthecomicrobium pneumaticum]